MAIRTLGDELATDPTCHAPSSFSVEIEGEPRDLQPIVRDETYKVAAEALRNSFRHAQAGRVEVELPFEAGLTAAKHTRREQLQHPPQILGGHKMQRAAQWPRSNDLPARQGSFDAGFDRHLVKPVGCPELQAVLVAEAKRLTQLSPSPNSSA